MIQKFMRGFRNEQTSSQDDNLLSIQLKENENKQIQFYNFWKEKEEDLFWFRFLKSRASLLKSNPTVNFGFYSVFGDRSIINKTATDINIFQSAENLKVPNYFEYLDHYLSSDKIDLALGFEYFDHAKYIRFPNWMDVFFLKTEEVKDVCNKLRFPNIEGKDRFASCVASHGEGGLRASIVDALKDVDDVSCPGRFRNNDDSLLHEYDDDKIEYLKRFQFNICPENSNALGYVTEKLFQAISVGCIPIYWGSYNRPELDVLNQDAIIFWEPEGDNTSTVKFIKELNDSPSLMKDFLLQPRLIPEADEYILNTFIKIENNLNQLIKNL